MAPETEDDEGAAGPADEMEPDQADIDAARAGKLSAQGMWSR
jgi:hypothetical protein